MISRDPTRFGGQQQAFVDASNAIVKNAAGQFRNASAQSQDLIQLFFRTLDSFAASRHNIAVSHKTPDVELFGIRRDRKEFFGPLFATVLGGPYSEYNDRLLPVIQKQLRRMEHDVFDFQQTKSQVYSERSLGRRTMMDYSILTQEVNSWQNINYSEEDYERLYKLCEATPDDEEHPYPHLTKNITAMQKLREKSPNDYRRLTLLTALQKLRRMYPDYLKSDWIHVAVRSPINGKMRDLSEYLTWANRDFVEDPVDHMTGRSIVAILHQDPFLLETMLDDLAKIFKNVIAWDGKNLKSLKDQVALFRYEFSHAAPFRRGSAAVAEWFERALYGAHGFKVAYNPDKMVDLEALTSSLKEFVDNYDSMITLTKIEEKASEPKVEL